MRGETAAGEHRESTRASACGPHLSARFSFAKQLKVQAAPLFIPITAKVELASESIDGAVLTAPSDALLSKPDQSARWCDNAFVRGIQRGGPLVDRTSSVRYFE